VPVSGIGGQHNEVLGNFVDAVLEGKELLGPASEGINGVELGNAMLMSALWNKTVELPLDSEAVEAQYRELIGKSRHKPKFRIDSGDFNNSFNSLADK